MMRLGELLMFGLGVWWGGWGGGGGRGKRDVMTYFDHGINQGQLKDY